MKVYFKITTVLILTLTIFFNMSYAGMADWTREDAEKEANIQMQEQEERMNEAQAKSDNYYLSSLAVEGYSLTPSFNKEITNYRIDGDVRNDWITIKATVEDSKASVSGDGKVAINSGANNIEIKVTAENGFTNVYYIIVNKPGENNIEQSSNNNISAIDENASKEENTIENVENKSKSNVSCIIAGAVIICIIALAIVVIKKNYNKKTKH